MSIDLKPELMEFVAEQVRSGRYESPEAVIEASLATLELQQQCGDFAPGELDRLLAEGEADIAAGRVVDGEEFFK